MGRKSTERSQIHIKVKGKLRFDNGEAFHDASVNWLGIKVNSHRSAYQRTKSGQLVHILQDCFLVSNMVIRAAYPISRLLALKMRAFIDYFSTQFGDLPYWKR